MQKPPKIYYVPGLGGDRRMFAPQLRMVYDSQVLEFIKPLSDYESLIDYAGRLGKAIDTTHPFILVGVSLGGIVSVELTKLLQKAGTPPLKTIIIASVKSGKEVPPLMKLGRKIPIHSLLNNSLFGFFSNFSKETIQIVHPKHADLFNDMLMDCDPNFLRWGMNQVVNWRNKSYPKNLIHIHGTKDRTFPFRYIHRPTHIIEGGTHFMNMDERAREINELIGLHVARQASA